MKHILLIATGGTIASAEDGSGLSPALTGEELARSVPKIEGLCELDIEDGQAKVVDGRIDRRGILGVHGRGAAGEDQR